MLALSSEAPTPALHLEPIAARHAIPTGDRWLGLGFLPGGIIAHRLDHLEAMVLTKMTPGFTAACIETISFLVQDLAKGRFGSVKFLIFDFAHDRGEGIGAEGFEHLARDLANLILEVPVVSVGWVRTAVAGADLGAALACSMMAAEEGSQFSFAADPIASIATYGLLAQKLGFVRAERLMENGEVLDVQQMRDLLLLKEIAPKGAGFAGIETFLRARSRKHNAFSAIYRAQRIAMPFLPGWRERPGGGLRGRPDLG